MLLEWKVNRYIIMERREMTPLFHPALSPPSKPQLRKETWAIRILPPSWKTQNPDDKREDLQSLLDNSFPLLPHQATTQPKENL